MPWLKLRKVLILVDAEEEIEVARGKFARIDEAIKGLIWLLERNPEPAGSFPTVLHNKQFNMYAWQGTADAGMPDMWVVYTFDDDQVEIHGINAMEPSTADDDDE
jgi:hypothetical protein